MASSLVQMRAVAPNKPVLAHKEKDRTLHKLIAAFYGRFLVRFISSLIAFLIGSRGVGGEGVVSPIRDKLESVCQNSSQRRETPLGGSQCV